MAKRRFRTILKVVVVLLSILIVAGGALWLFGPRDSSEYSIAFDPALIGDDPAAYLARTEVDVPNLRADAQKEIVWAYPASRARTPIAIVYIHGFSASKNELRPLPDLVAKKLGANLFLTRLAGHGRDGAAMAEGSVNDWMNDYAEALAIGRRLGERVVVIGNSTGATLEVIGASDAGLMKDVSGLVMLSPNLGVANRWGFVLDLPYARDFAPKLFGEEWGGDTSDPAIAAVWTMRYPSVALMPMAAAVRGAWASDFSSATIPALFMFSARDTVVDPAKTRRLIGEWQGPKEVEELSDSQDPNQHILAGDIVSPTTTAPLADRITAWIETLPKS
ncbi:alpha/beta hydrolase [Aureimonas psammosilenae]|uniref:alpha/beta hydrolase n=1 Tax=Aureimonas psammosilenae TaxID=2495496 RepID=UPI0012612E32|nr:alpha/beta fold hydrolase [Aureimonas psammosilenae]